MKESERVKRVAKHISEAAKLMGWDIIVPKGDRVEYIIIGNGKELDRIAKILRRKKK